MTEIPEHLLKRAQRARDKARELPEHLLRRSAVAKPERPTTVEERKEKAERRAQARTGSLHRRFRFNRTEDFSGVSGTGHVAWGVEFPDGTVVLRWNSVTPSTAIYASIKEVQAIHGHEGRTKIEWVDGPESD